MLIGAHTVIYSPNPEADRAFFRDVLGLRGVDAGRGFMIFALPPAEVSTHETGESGHHELYLMCDNVEAFIEQMKGRDIACGAVKDEGWGLLTQVTLPSGAKLGVYEPRHARPSPARAKAPKPARRATKTLAKPSARRTSRKKKK
jgi:catechol 2,3-dioxygenase-like lactoylglutathione lyase family enzyme